MYVSPNFKTKKALREALAAGKEVSVFSPGPFPCPRDGSVALEGPHYPAAHTWYAAAVLEAGRIVKIDGKSVSALRAKFAAPPVALAETATASPKAAAILRRMGVSVADSQISPVSDRAAIDSAESRGMIGPLEAAILRDMPRTGGRK